MLMKSFLLLFYLGILVQAVRFKFDRIEYRFNQTVTNLSAKLNEKKILNTDWDVMVEVSPIYVNFSLTTGSNFTKVIYSRSFDLCKAFSGKSVTRFVLVVLELFHTNSNAPYICPYPVGHYYIHDVDIGRLSLPLVLGQVGPVKTIVKCNLVLTSKTKDGRSIFLAEYDFYSKLIKK